MFEVNAQRVRGLVVERGLSLRGFARAAELNELTARRALTDGTKLSLSVIGALAKYFGVGADELIVSPKGR